METARIDRGFIRIAAGQVHYRYGGDARADGPLPLYMAHAGPGSSLSLVSLMEQLGKRRRVIAPDMLGNGDSDPPAVARTDVAYYADCIVQILDGLGIDRIDFYGSHTGAHIGCEFALRYPERIGRLVLDGIGLFPPDLKAQMVERYAPVVQPDDHGGHLLWAWSFAREMFVHFPHFLRDPAHRLYRSAVPNAATIQQFAVDLLKALPTYHLAYHAVFAYPMAERLALLRLPTLVMAVDADPLAIYHDEAAALVTGAVKKLVTREQRLKAIEDFLDA